jgi:hypothetical protein
MKFIIILNRNLENLDLLIKSIENQVDGEFSIAILDQNNLLKDKKIQENYNYLIVNDLKKQLIEIVESDIKNNFTIIDENKFFYEKVDLEIINNTLLDQEIFCFGMGLGKNITHCSNLNCDNVFIPEKEENGILIWDWSKHYMDFGYPFNLDGTVYRGKELLKFIKNINFSDTLELENNLQIFDNYPKNFMACFEKSKIIELIFENKKEISNFNLYNFKIDRMKFLIKSKITDEITN